VFGALLVAIVAAVALFIFALWLPSVHANQDRKWQAAGQRALAQVSLPAPFRVYDDNGARIGVCGTGPLQRCFVAPGDPASNVARAQAALTRQATGPIRNVCQPTPLPHSPPTCSVLVPVAGSRLVVNLFARADSKGKPLADWTYSGTYALVHLDNR
jgi:hypothetical protein